MFLAGMRVDDHPSALVVPNEDPHVRRREVAEILRARQLAANPPHEPWPSPEIPMRVVELGSCPSAPARLVSRLVRADWRVVVTYARGTLSVARDGFTGTGAEKRPKHYPARIVGSWAVRAGAPGRRAVAIWHVGADGKLSAQGVLRWGDSPAHWIGMQQFEREIGDGT